MPSHSTPKHRRWPTGWALAACCGMLVALAGRSGTADEPLGGLDAELLNQLTDGLDLGSDLLPDTPSPRPTPAEPSEGEPRDDDGEHELPTDPPPREAQPQPVDPDSPLAEVSRRMRDVERWLRSSDSGEATRRTQGEIVEQLARLIELSKEPQPPSSSPQPQPQEPDDGEEGDEMPQETDEQGPADTPTDSDNPDATDSSERRETPDEGGTPPPPAERLAQFLQAEWGHLPERERQQVIQSFTERFLPEYDPLIRAYYESLSQPSER